MITAGIDLAADPKRTGVCRIDWSTSTPAVNIGAVGAYTDAGLADLMMGVARTGIDCPLGWPDPFVEAIQTYHPGNGWTAGAQRGPLKFRATDEFVGSQPGGRLPLSVSTDRIGVTAMRCAYILQLVAERGGEIDRTGMKGIVTEVYPAAALRRWELDARGYKAPKAIEKRSDLLTSIERQLAWPEPLDQDVRAACTATDHALDAFVSALVARAAAGGLTTGPGRSMDRAEREGWIHLPTCDLAHLMRGEC